MYRVYALLLALAVHALGQFDDVVVSRDGNSIAFAAKFRLKGQEQPGAVYRWGTLNGFRAVPGSAGAPEMSDDGRVFGWSEAHWGVKCYVRTRPDSTRSATASFDTDVRREMHDGNSGKQAQCHDVLVASSVIQLPNGTEIRRPESVQISRNGRFALYQKEILDLQTGLVRTLEPPTSPIPSPPGRRITSAGEALEIDLNVATVLGPQGTRRAVLEGDSGYESASISDDGRHVVYVTRLFPQQIRLIDIHTGADVLLGAAVESVSGPPVASDDGRVIAWVTTTKTGTELVTWTEAAGTRLAPIPGDAPRRVSLSGDGRIAWISTRWNRLIRYDLVANTLTEVIPRTPAYEVAYGGETPGSLMWLQGTGLSDRTASAATPLPRELAGVRVGVGDEWCAISSVSPERILCQLPWETQPGREVKVTVSSASPFERSWPLQIPDHPSYLERIQVGLDFEGSYTLVIKGDWSGFVGSASPAKPGDVLHFYATGLGPVTPAVATGVPGPAIEPLARLVTEPVCRTDSDAPVRVLFAGLAPGLVGLYQISMQLPARLDMKPGQRVLAVYCDVGNRFLGGSFAAEDASTTSPDD